MENSYEIDDLIYPLLKEYGFKRRNTYSKVLYLDNIIEFRTKTVKQVGNKKLIFELSDISKRNIGYHWGGYISTMELDHTFDDNIILSTLDGWLRAIFELEEMQKYSRSLKVNKLKENACK